jgi:exopolysaccharide biosynthesis polyprenyl glycosylphosphotransferase
LRFKGGEQEMTNVVLEQVVREPEAARRRRWRGGRTRLLVLGDLIALVAAYAGTYAVATFIAPPALIAPNDVLIVLGLFAVPTWIAVFTAYHLYDHDNNRIAIASFDEVSDIFHALLAGSLGFLLLAQVLRRLENWWIYSALEAALFLGASLVLVPLIRGSLRSWLFPRMMERRRTLILGGGPEADLVRLKLESHPEYGLEVVAVLNAAVDDGDGNQLRSADDIAATVEELEIDRVLIASSIASHEEMLDLLRTVRRQDVQISIVPRYFEIFTSHATFDDIQGIPVVTLPPLRLGRSSRLLKRSVDIAVSGAALTLLAPLLGLIALAIRFDTPGSPIYRQPRRGREGSTFSIAKFRTMSVGAEKRRAEVLHMNEVDGPLFKIKGDDPRVTRIGGFLRKTSLDELPQLWNVLRGDMSLVGPRPFVVYEADLIEGWGRSRLDMTPGITGLWQMLGRNDIPFDEMVKLDYLYVTNWSVWWDLKILFQTIPVVLGRRGAY